MSNSLELSQLVNKRASVRLEKNTEGDKRSILRNAVSSTFTIDGRNAHAYLYDYDDTYVYFEIYDCHYDYSYWRHPYTFSGTSAEFPEGDAVEVVPLTDWRVVGEEEPVTKTWLKEFLSKNFGSTSKEQMVIKQFDDEQMIAIEPLYVPAGVVDAHGDEVASHDVTKGMVDSLNKAIQEGNLQSGLFHKHLTDGYKIEKAWMNEVESMIGDTLVAEGQPLVKVQFTNEELWKQRKEGNLTGLSIGAKASVEELNDE